MAHINDKITHLLLALLGESSLPLPRSGGLRLQIAQSRHFVLEGLLLLCSAHAGARQLVGETVAGQGRHHRLQTLDGLVAARYHVPNLTSALHVALVHPLQFGIELLDVLGVQIGSGRMLL